MQKNLKIATFLAAIFAFAVFSSKYFYTTIRSIMSYQGYEEYNQEYQKSLEENNNNIAEYENSTETFAEDLPNLSELKTFDYEAPITEVDTKSLPHVQSKKIDYNNYADRVRLEEPDFLDENGLYEALMQAVADNDIKRAKLLISKGASVNSLDGKTSFAPIFWAISNGNVETVKLLISKGAKLNTPDEKGYFPIHWVIEQSSMRPQVYQMKQILDLILKANPTEINRQDTVFKETPIMIAITLGNNKAFAYLLDKGANLTLINKEGQNATALALTNSCHTCLQLIKNKEIINETTPLANFASTFTAPADIWLPKSAIKTVKKAKKVERDPNSIVIEGNNLLIPQYKEMPEILPLDKEDKGPDIIIREK